MKAVRRQGRILAATGGLGMVLLAAQITALAPTSEAQAGWPWQNQTRVLACGHAGCAPNQCLAPTGDVGEWYWMRSPDQERRVVMALYNRYCIRCHGIDGRGVWDIPDVPDFTDTRWQTSRPDPQIVNIVMEGRGAVMPSFRGTLTLEESWAMARYLRTLVPGTEVARPVVGRAQPPAAAPRPPAPARAATTSSTLPGGDRSPMPLR